MLTTVFSGKGAFSVIALISKSNAPAERFPPVSTLLTLMLFTITGSTAYVFINVTFCVALAVNVPSLLSFTVTVIVFAVSFVTPATVPLSVTVYVYVPGTVNVRGSKLTLPSAAFVEESITVPSLSVSVNVNAPSILSGPVNPSGTESSL